ncbi:hypothetical protein B1F84_11920 [Pseudoalteromonas sp. DL-6]|nr:hypothetical protein B1F84_11920 [Pseudoalteromonas sp. DL-6]
MIANTKNNACGHFNRKLVEESFNVHSIKDFGVITEGIHIFCHNKTNQCEGKADFVMIWHKVDDKWEITRVLSYGHREINKRIIIYKQISIITFSMMMLMGCSGTVPKLGLNHGQLMPYSESLNCNNRSLLFIPTLLNLP